MNSLSKKLFLFVLLFFCVSSVYADSTLPEVDWRLVAKSHFIVEGKIDVPVQEIEHSTSLKKNKYITIAATVETVHKGEKIPQNIEISFYTKDASYKPSISLLTKLNGSHVLMCLVKMHGKYYFSRYNRARREVSNELSSLVKNEVMEQ